MQVGFVTFGDGQRRWKAAAKRIESQAHKSGYFQTVASYDYSDIKHRFTSEDKQFVKENPDGFGYFLFKPIVILQFLEENPKIDVVVYLDAGSEIDSSAIKHKKFKHYMDIVSEFGYLVFQLENIEENWSKADLARLIGSSTSDLQTGQIAGGHLIFTRDFAISHCAEWLEIMRTDNYHFLDHSASRIPNSANFISHRNDQSIASLLLKRKEYKSFRPAAEMEPNPGKFKEQEDLGPFIATRNASRYSRLSDNIAIRLIRKIHETIFEMIEIVFPLKPFC